MNDEQIVEAANCVQQSVGSSVYLHGIGYSVEKFRQELDKAVKHIKNQTKVKARA